MYVGVQAGQGGEGVGEGVVAVEEAPRRAWAVRRGRGRATPARAVGAASWTPRGYDLVHIRWAITCAFISKWKGVVFKPRIFILKNFKNCIK